MKRLALALLAWITCQTANAQHADILIALNNSGTRLVSGSADISTSSYVVGQRVFEAEFGSEPLLPYLASEPGYNAVTIPTGGIALPGNSALNFSFKKIHINSTTSNLYYWNGVGEVNFTPVSDGTNLTASRSGGFSATVDGSATDINGFTISTTSSTGSIHRHLDFELTNTSGNPSDGIYLVAQQFHMNGVQDSDMIFLVFNSGLNELAHEDAVAWVELNTPVPEPLGVIAVTSLGGLMLRSLRRRRKLN